MLSPSSFSSSSNSSQSSSNPIPERGGRIDMNSISAPSSQGFYQQNQAGRYPPNFQQNPSGYDQRGYPQPYPPQQYPPQPYPSNYPPGYPYNQAPQNPNFGSAGFKEIPKNPSNVQPGNQRNPASPMIPNGKIDTSRFVQEPPQNPLVQERPEPDLSQRISMIEKSLVNLLHSSPFNFGEENSVLFSGIFLFQGSKVSGLLGKVRLPSKKTTSLKIDVPLPSFESNHFENDSGSLILTFSEGEFTFIFVPRENPKDEVPVFDVFVSL